MKQSSLLLENNRLLVELAEKERQLQVKTCELRDNILELTEERLRRLNAEEKLKKLLKRLFGSSSEKIDPRQHMLVLDSIEADQRLAQAEQPAPAPEPAAVPVPTRAKRGPRRPIPADLPVERVVHDLPEAEKHDAVTGEALVQIREEITEEIDFRPSQFVRVQHVVPVYAPADKSCAPVQAKLVRVIPGSAVGTALLSHILVARFTDHLPYYRQSQIAARQGVTLDRQKMSRWVEQVAVLLQAVFRMMEQRLIKTHYIQCDETAVRVLDPDRPGAARQAYLWVRHAPEIKVILFDFEMSRSHEVPLGYFPENWKGIVQGDGYAAYDKLAKSRPGIVRIQCWAHARRYWTEAADGGGLIVAEVLALIAKLYRVETEARGMTPAQRETLRGSRSVIILAQLQKLMLTAREQALPQSRVGKAAHYALSRWSELTQYAQPEFGHVLIDSNPIENGIRPTALGKKNWIFVGHPEAGWKSAVVYSILGTCKLLGVNPEDYLNWVLPRLAGATNQTTGLLPHDYLKLVKEQAQPTVS
jgi:transposase